MRLRSTLLALALVFPVADACANRVVNHLPGVIVSDNFDSYADGADLGSQPNWSDIDGSFSIKKPASDGAARVTVAGVYAAGYTAASFAENQFAEITLGEVDNTYVGVCVRGDPGTGDGYMFYSNATTWYLFYSIAGSASNVQTGSDTLAVGNRLRLEVTGSGTATRLTAYIDTGSGFAPIIANWDPTSYFSGGYPGLSGYFASNDSTATDWTGGNL